MEKKEVNYLIEKNIPVIGKKESYSRYPFSKMEQGDSFLVEVPEGKTKANTVNAIRVAFIYYASQNKLSWECTVRSIDSNHIRIWRIR